MSHNKFLLALSLLAALPAAGAQAAGPKHRGRAECERLCASRYHPSTHEFRYCVLDCMARPRRPG